MASSAFLFPPISARNSPRTRCCMAQRRQQPPHICLSNTLTEIENSGVIACLRADSGELAMDAARTALGAGISVLEVVMSTPGVLEVIEELVREFPNSVIGAGTVLTATEARLATEAGAKFLMSPATEIFDHVKHSNILYIPGAMSPTEVLNAYNSGAKVVKVYPVSALGGPQYIAAIKKPFASIPMVASQGITLVETKKYIFHGASAVVLSDAIFQKEAMAENNFDVIYQNAHCAALHGRHAAKRKRGVVR